MTNLEQRIFIKDLINSIGDSILDKTKRFPENWNGRQLRRFVVEEFARLAPCGPAFDRKETRKYEQERLGADI